MQPTKKLSPAIIAIIVIVLIGAVAAAVIVINNANQQTTEVPGVRETQSGVTPSSETAANATYTNGTYTQTGAYSTPGGRESITVTVTLENDTIIATELTQHATAGDSRQYQSRFASGYKDLIVGKDIDTVSLSRVAGSSLTSNGFNDALDVIKADAKV